MTQTLASYTTTESNKWTNWVLNFQKEREYLKLCIKSGDGDSEGIRKERLGGGLA